MDASMNAVIVALIEITRETNEKFIRCLIPLATKMMWCTDVTSLDGINIWKKLVRKSFHAHFESKYENKATRSSAMSRFCKKLLQVITFCEKFEILPASLSVVDLEKIRDNVLVTYGNTIKRYYLLIAMITDI